MRASCAAETGTYSRTILLICGISARARVAATIEITVTAIIGDNRQIWWRLGATLTDRAALPPEGHETPGILRF